MRGEVRLWHSDRGFGLCRLAGFSDLVFVHGSMLPPGQVPKVGDVLEFDNVQEVARGLRAVGWVTIVQPPEEESDGD
jgi:cold shock CspA family protein